MIDVAIATNRVTADPDEPALVAALAREGVRAVRAAWDDEDVDWGSFAATVIRSTWYYPLAYDEFVAWVWSIERLINPADVVMWNADKRYLDDLAQRGVPTIETTSPRRGVDAAFPDGDFVVKPTVGGGSRGARRFARSDAEAARAHVDALADQGRVAMIQPYVETVATLGETDVIVIDGEASHAVRKHVPINLEASVAPAGLASAERVEPSSAERSVAAAALAAVPFASPLCFARVDLVSTTLGPAVIEVELIEPFLFLAHDASAAQRLARAIVRRVRD